MTEHFVEIEVNGKRQTETYRFYGRGVWKIKDRDNWRPINGVFVPAEVLAVAAAQCSNVP